MRRVGHLAYIMTEKVPTGLWLGNLIEGDHLKGLSIYIGNNIEMELK
jgi:hypothetical protein